MYKDLVEYIVRNLVDTPDAVEISEVEDDEGLIIEIRVADGDTGRVIGRGGRVINAIRTLVDSRATQENRSITLEVI